MSRCGCAVMGSRRVLPSLPHHHPPKKTNATTTIDTDTGIDNDDSSRWRSPRPTRASGRAPAPRTSCSAWRTSPTAGSPATGRGEFVRQSVSLSASCMHACARSGLGLDLGRGGGIDLTHSGGGSWRSLLLPPPPPPTPFPKPTKQNKTKQHHTTPGTSTPASPSRWTPSTRTPRTRPGGPSSASATSSRSPTAAAWRSRRWAVGVGAGEGEGEGEGGIRTMYMYVYIPPPNAPNLTHKTNHTLSHTHPPIYTHTNPDARDGPRDVPGVPRAGAVEGGAQQALHHALLRGVRGAGRGGRGDPALIDMIN